MHVPAKFGIKLSNNEIKCQLCPIECVIPIGAVGVCRYRKNIDGNFFLTNYGTYTSLAVENIEKKPLYHYFPGAKVASIGTNGCNMGCTFCQNYLISQQEYPTKDISHSDLVSFLVANNVIGLCYTFNEPLISFEYLIDSAKEIKKAGFKVIINTNGLINPEPLEELLPYIDAINLDIKGFTESFYLRVCKTKLTPVLQNSLKLSNKHLEISHLVIAGEEDQKSEELGIWILENLGNSIPIHLNAYYPRYLLKNPATPASQIRSLVQYFKHIGHKYVYPGNIIAKDESNTYCLGCGTLLISRIYNQISNSLIGNKCPKCSLVQPIIIT